LDDRASGFSFAGTELTGNPDGRVDIQTRSTAKYGQVTSICYFAECSHEVTLVFKDIVRIPVLQYRDGVRQTCRAHCNPHNLFPVPRFMTVYLARIGADHLSVQPVCQVSGKRCLPPAGPSTVTRLYTDAGFAFMP
jgi:hypothetical protein